MKTSLNLSQSARTEPKSDIYVKSINNIISSSAPRTIEKVEELLENNGYYGRAKVRKVPTKNYRETAIKVEVYLPDSIITYNWPFETYYNLSKVDFGKRTRPRVIKKNEALIKCMYFFLIQNYRISNNLEAVAEIGHLYMGWATKEEYIHMIRFLIKAGLFRDGWFALKSKQDVLEVYNNLFDYNYYLKI
jgi:hypothetical protein